MGYCPKCHHEYADTLTRCVDCGTPLVRGVRPPTVSLDLDDLIVPIGAAFCGVVALVMLWLRVAAQFGWIKGTFAQLIQTGQPPCMTVFYAFAVIASVVVLTWWVIHVFILKRG